VEENELELCAGQLRTKFDVFLTVHHELTIY